MFFFVILLHLNFQKAKAGNQITTTKNDNDDGGEDPIQFFVKIYRSSIEITAQLLNHSNFFESISIGEPLR